MLQSCTIYSSQFFFQAINSRYRFLHCMGGQTPTWIRDQQMARKKLLYGRMDGKEKKLMADIIFIKGKSEDGRSPNSIMKYLFNFFIVHKIL